MTIRDYVAPPLTSEEEATLASLDAERATVPCKDCGIMSDEHDSNECIARLKEQRDTIRAALRPFARAGHLFLPNDPTDDSGYVSEPDEALIGHREVWKTTPLTIGDLRRACRALGEDED